MDEGVLLSSGGLDIDIARWSDIDCGVLVSRYWQRHGRDIRGAILVVQRRGRNISR